MRIHRISCRISRKLFPRFDNHALQVSGKAAANHLLIKTVFINNGMIDPLRMELNSEGEEALYQISHRMWHPVAFEDDVTETPFSFQLLDEMCVAVKLGGQISVFQDLCIHRGTALSLGRVIGDELQCAYHGWRFSAGGACTLIPSRPNRSIPPKAQIRKYSSILCGGLLWVCLRDHVIFPPPVFREWNNPNYRIVRVPTYVWHSSAARRIENFVDFSHFPFVHAGILGLPNKAEIPDHDVIRNNHCLIFELGIEEPTNELKGDQALGVVVKRQPSKYTISMPYSVELNQPLGDHDHFVLFMASSPISRKVTRTFCYCARNYDVGSENDEKFVEFQNVILEQDRVVVESQRPAELPIDLSEELHTKGVDLVSIEYRKWLQELAHLQSAT